MYGQIAPQGWFGNLLGNIGAPVGGAIGGLLGNQQLGGQIGGMAGGLAHRYLPFEVDPLAAMYGQVAPQGWLGDLLNRSGARLPFYNPFIPVAPRPVFGPPLGVPQNGISAPVAA
jgi:hypothetical protein